MQFVIHPKMVINITTRHKRYRSYFENEYARVSGYKALETAININVHIVKNIPTPAEPDRTKTIRFKKVLKYDYLVRGFETNNVDIYFKDTFAGKLYAKNVTLFLQAQLIEPIIYYKFLQQNILFMHSAGVSDGKSGYIFPAYGGTGKTTLALGLMAEGMKILGDDLLIVDPVKCEVSSYLRPLHIFAYNIKSLRDAKIPYYIQAKIYGKNVLRYMLEFTTRQKFLISTRVHADTLYENLEKSETVPYKKIVFLKKTGEDEKIKITDSSIEELATIILESEDLNDSLYENILENKEVGAVKTLELSVIKNVLKNVSHLHFTNTRLLDFRDLNDFKKKLSE